MYRFNVDEDARLVVATFEGEVGDADLFDYLADMLASTDYGAGWHTLIDFTPAAVLRLTSQGVRRMRTLPTEMEDRLRGARAAILAPEGSAAFGMGRMYQIMGESAAYEVAVFSDRRTAMDWLFAD